jgi:hypothetical protein
MLTSVGGNAAAPTLLCQYFCCLILPQLNFIALRLMPTARLIFYVPSVAVQFQSVCEIKFSNFKG